MAAGSRSRARRARARRCAWSCRRSTTATCCPSPRAQQTDRRRESSAAAADRHRQDGPGMDLATVDLNLMVVFEAMMRERNVSRAARRVGLAQPSMSNALNRLRELFGDELFVRTPREMRPTTKALMLARPIHEALHHIRGAF